MLQLPFLYIPLKVMEKKGKEERKYHISQTIMNQDPGTVGKVSLKQVVQ